MHAKTDSEATSIDASWLPRSPRRLVYYVQSPSNHDVEKMSYGSSPPASPAHHHYHHCSPIQHSRESTTSIFSASLKKPQSLSAWKRVQLHHDDDDDEDETDGRDGGSADKVRLYFCIGLLFVLMFTAFCLILWGASKSYKPEIIVKNIVFENFNVQAGNDGSGVATDMLSLNSIVKVLYRNPATFFAVHVTSTPLELHYFSLKLAAGQMKEFKESRKRQRMVVTVVKGDQVPLYGGVSVLANAGQQLQRVEVPLNLTFLVRSRAFILGKLVKSKFYSHIRCSITLKGSTLGKPLNLTNSCVYD